MSAVASPRPDDSDNRIVELPGFRSALDPSRALRVGGRGLPREYVVRVQRERLIDAFVQVVAEEGYDRAWIKTICQRAGVAFNTFYEYFDNKEELFLTSFDAGVKIVFEEAGLAYLAGDVPWAARVEAAIRSFLETLAANPAFARVFAVEVSKVGAVAMDRVDQAFAQSYLMFSNAELAIDVTMKSDRLLPLIIGGLYSRIQFYIRSGKTSELPDLLPDLTEFVMTAFRERGTKASAGPAGLAAPARAAKRARVATATKATAPAKRTKTTTSAKSAKATTSAKRSKPARRTGTSSAAAGVGSAEPTAKHKP